MENLELVSQFQLFIKRFIFNTNLNKLANFSGMLIIPDIFFWLSHAYNLKTEIWELVSGYYSKNAILV
jgi:hypothetical protein